MATSAVRASAVSATLALPIMLSCWNIHVNSLDVALLSLYYNTIAVSLAAWHISLVSAVTVAACVRHVWF
ncbi:uncharacterized protein LOC114379654 [Glycine soja]|uniref:uncharacterized protein LOC114379654 n=1 Tax=Glycine soja TaxID=3848 RepID=UPI0003DEC00F|nr:uncharacterized protein LOC114379654 [Glycine soja]